MKPVFKRIFRGSNINLAYLIGSRAIGTNREDSDFDIVLITDNATGVNFAELYSKIDCRLEGGDLDLRVIDPKQTDPLFLFQIIKTGIILYQKSEIERIKFESYGLKMYYDNEHVRNTYNHYLEKRFHSQTYGR